MSDLPGRVKELRITAPEQPAFGGMSFGKAGAYEAITASALCEVDPAHRLNQGIVNLQYAPRNADGFVEYEVDVCLLKPVDASRGNGWLFHEVLNRGSKRGVPRLNDADPANELDLPDHAGNGYMMRQGYTLAWVAWQGDTLPGGGRMLARFPVPTKDGQPITGLCRDETIADAPGSVRDELIEWTSDGTFTVILSYHATTLDPSQATLTVRQNERDPRVTPPGLGWRYLDDRRIEITRPPGFDRGAIYEFIFPARDPVVHGLGFTAVRDVIAFLRSADPRNPLVGTIRHAMLYGISQSGRMIRDYLYRGFNEAAPGQMVFEAMMPVIAGSRRMFMNHAFAQTSRYPRQHEDHSYPGDQFPFAYTTLTDPISGRTDGLLESARSAGVVPKLLHVDTDSEVWSARASLVVTDTQGNDIAQPDEVRVYMLAGLPHGSYKPPTPGVTQAPPNPLTYGIQLRALVHALRQWVEDGIAPPPSRAPSRAAGTLVTLADAKARFPAIPGVDFPGIINVVRLMDHSQEPPVEGAAYPVFAHATDADGNGVDGIRHPFVAAPRAAYTGWCLRASGYAQGELYSVAGSCLPFAATKAQRTASGDPRLSLEERYGSHERWVQRLAEVCDAAVADRLLLPEDRDRLLAQARTDQVAMA